MSHKSLIRDELSQNIVIWNLCFAKKSFNCSERVIRVFNIAVRIQHSPQVSSLLS